MIADRASTWGAELSPAPPFDVEGYQNKLNRIAGFTQQGEPVLRLVWGGERFRYQVTKFDSFRNPLEWGKVPQYAFLSKKQETFGQRIPIRRWIIEENTDCGQLEAMGGKTGNIRTEEKGFYTWKIIIADHSKCGNCKADEGKCFGDYKEPNDAELNLIRQWTNQLEIDRKDADPRKMITPEMAARLMTTPKLDEKELAEKEEAENEQAVNDWLKIHGSQVQVDLGKNL